MFVHYFFLQYSILDVWFNFANGENMTNFVKTKSQK